jgi:hypothetical protein
LTNLLALKADRNTRTLAANHDTCCTDHHRDLAGLNSLIALQ